MLGPLGAILGPLGAILVSIGLFSAPPGGADDIVNYEVFGTSSYLGHLRVLLAILGPS